MVKTNGLCRSGGGKNCFDLVGKDQGTCVELIVFEVRKAQGSS